MKTRPAIVPYPLALPVKVLKNVDYAQVAVQGGEVSWTRPISQSGTLPADPTWTLLPTPPSSHLSCSGGPHYCVQMGVFELAGDAAQNGGAVLKGEG